MKKWLVIEICVLCVLFFATVSAFADCSLGTFQYRQDPSNECGTQTRECCLGTLSTYWGEWGGPCIAECEMGSWVRLPSDFPGTDECGGKLLKGCLEVAPCGGEDKPCPTVRRGIFAAASIPTSFRCGVNGNRTCNIVKNCTDNDMKNWCGAHGGPAYTYINGKYDYKSTSCMSDGGISDNDEASWTKWCQDNPDLEGCIFYGNAASWEGMEACKTSYQLYSDKSGQCFNKMVNISGITCVAGSEDTGVKYGRLCGGELPPFLGI